MTPEAISEQISKGIDIMTKLCKSGITCPNDHGDCGTCPGSPEPGKIVCRVGMKIVADFKAMEAARAKQEAGEPPF